MADDGDKVPEEIEQQCVDLHHAVAAVERSMKPLLATNRVALGDTLSPMDEASLSLLLSYTLNSLFWVYLSTQGVNPKEHHIRRELDRIQQYMKRAAIVNEKHRGGVKRLNTETAKRFVRNALFEDKHQLLSKQPNRLKPTK